MNFWKNKRVLVTGGGGFIGSHLVEKLCALGARVTVADLNLEHAKRWLEPIAERIRFALGDLSEGMVAAEATRAQDVVFHMASKMAGLRYNARHPAEMFVDNTLLDLQVLKWCARNGASRVLFCSGALVYDRKRPIPTGENAGIEGAPNPDCEGSVWAKRAGERAARYYFLECGLNVVIARLANVYGPRDDFAPGTAHLVGNLIRTIADGGIPELHGDGHQLRSYLFVTDAVEALVGLVEADAWGEAINICGGTETTVLEVLNTVMAVMGVKTDPILCSGPTGVDRRLLDTTRLQALTGFQERVPFEEGIRRTVEWYRTQRETMLLT